MVEHENFFSFKKIFESLTLNRKVSVDFAQANMDDQTFIEQVYHFKDDYEAAGGTLIIIGLHQANAWLEHAHSVRTAKKRKQ